MIDELQIYNRSLSAGEVAGLVPEPGTVVTLASASILLLLRRCRQERTKWDVALKE